MSALQRRTSVGVNVGGVMVGGGAPIVVQSMTNTDTADIEATVRQIGQLYRAGSELVRITVDRDEAAAAVPHIRDRLMLRGIDVPIIGDFHYIGHKLLTDHPACAEALAKYRINPGNVGFKAKRDTQFSTLIELALKWNKPVRIGVNWGSLDEELLTKLMDENAVSAESDLGGGGAARGDHPVGAALGAARRGDRAFARQDHPLDEGVGRSAPDRGLSGSRGALRLCAPSRAHRGGDGIEGHRRLVGRDGHPVAAGDRRHDPRLADARAQRRPDAGSAGVAGAAADHGVPPVPAGGRGVPGLRAHDLDGVPVARAGHPDAPLDLDAGVEGTLSRASRRSRSR